AKALDLLENPVDKFPICRQMLATGCRDGVNLLVAFRGRYGEACLLQIGQRRIDHARAWTVEPARKLLQGLDDVVAVPRLAIEQGQRDQLEVAVRQHPPRPE